MRLLKRGAEGDLYRDVQARHIIKIRRPKEYRNAALDSAIREKRTIREASMLVQVKSFGVPAPLVYMVDSRDSSITMQYIPGKTVMDIPDAQIPKRCREIGRLVALMHKNGITHGDLTTSNFVVYRNRIFVIDFGLAKKTSKDEDKAVDLRLFKEILYSAHAKIAEDSWRVFLAGYGGVAGRKNLERMTRLVSEIEGRGRYAAVV